MPGPDRADRTLVAVGKAFQNRTDHHARYPGL